jgi:four helix bundle protein
MWNFRKVDAWNRAVEFSKVIYEVSKRFPDYEKYGLSNQLRRAVVSISSNIAEGCGRRTSKDFVSFMYNAIGSLKEVESELFVAEKLGYVGMEDVERLFEELEEIGRMLTGMIRKESERNVR